MRSEYRFLLALGLSTLVAACGDDKPQEQKDPAGDSGDNSDGGAQRDGGANANDGEDDDTDNGPGDAGAQGDGDNDRDDGGDSEGENKGDGHDEPGADCAQATQPTKLVTNVETMFLRPRLGGEHVYFSDDNAIKRVHKCGGAVETILEATNLRGFDVYDGYVYFTDDEGVRKAPAEPEASATTIVEATRAGAIDARAEGVFWAQGKDGGLTIHGASLDGTGASQLSESEGSTSQVIADETHVYWLALTTTIFRAAIDGSSQTPTVVLRLPDGGASDYFALDETQVYMTDDNNANDTSLWRAPKDGSKPEGIRLAYLFGKNASAVVAASGVIYFATRNSTSNVYRIEPDAEFTTTPMQIGSSKRIADLAVDAQDLFMRMNDQPWDIERLSRQ